jgi:beta-N-acetylhexosaminidase
MAATRDVDREVGRMTGRAFRIAVVTVLAGSALAACTGGRPTADGPSAAPAPSPSSVPPSAAAGTPTPAPTATAGTAPTGEACVAATVGNLTLPGQVGQLLMIGTSIDDPTAIVPTVRRYRLGAVFLAGRSSRSAATLRRDIRTIQRAARDATGMPVEVALDQEGGLVQTLSGGDFPTIPSALRQGRWSTATLSARTTDWARRLADAGVTMNLAPVADTVPAGTAGANPPIGALDRQYGSAPDAVARDVATVVRAAQSAGVMTTLKHFPGLGRVRENTDTSTGAVDSTATPGDPYLRPFAAGIEAGTGAVMVSSARYPNLDGRSIAAFSTPIVTGLLRERLGFTGIIVSDDLGAAAAAGSVPVGQRAVRFVRAGGDLVLTVRPADAGPMADALVAAARQYPSFAARVTDAAENVVRAKVNAGLLTCSP